MYKLKKFQNVGYISVFISALVCWTYSQNPVKQPDTSANQLTTSAGLSDTNNRKYIVKKNDCLWNIALQRTGNPFQWPVIWHLNPYIKNPDLIYPGDTILLSEGKSITSVAPSASDLSGKSNSQKVTNPIQSKTEALLHKEMEKKDVLVNTQHDSSSDSLLLSIIKSKDQLGGNFFASVPFLWFERNGAGVLLPGESVVEKPAEKAMYQLFDKIIIDMKKGEKFNIGDSLDLFAYFRVVEFKHARATILKCVGTARVSEIKGDKAFATLYKAFDKVLGGEHLLKSNNIKGREIDSLVVPQTVIKGAVFTRAEETESPYIFQTIIMDKGSQDGVKLGDVFAIFPGKEEESSTDVSVIGYTANVQKNSSSLTIIKMSNNKIDSGDKVVLIRRTMFKGGEN